MFFVVCIDDGQEEHFTAYALDRDATEKQLQGFADRMAEAFEEQWGESATGTFEIISDSEAEHNYPDYEEISLSDL